MKTPKVPKVPRNGYRPPEGHESCLVCRAGAKSTPPHPPEPRSGPIGAGRGSRNSPEGLHHASDVLGSPGKVIAQLMEGSTCT